MNKVLNVSEPDLSQEGLDSQTRAILAVCQSLDDYGARHWNLRWVAVVFAGMFLAVKLIMGKKRGIEWYSLVHSLITGWGSLACVYLDFAFEEPLRSISQCQQPLTTLHRILPAVTMGYSLLDMADGLATQSFEFALHGLATLTIMAFFCEIGFPQLVTPMLLMEVSSVFLNLVRADFFTMSMNVINQMFFALSFFAFRVLLVPYIWTTAMQTAWNESSSEKFQSCFPSNFFKVCIPIGIFFHSLNAYWFVKVVKKARKKFLGIEKIHHNNDLAESEHASGELQNGKAKQS